MKRERIAIVGTGISGMASAWLLHPFHDITVFEKEPRVGGHSHTVAVSENNREVSIDTGFMVYNEVTYPLLTRLFKHLNVVTKPTSMSFSVQHIGDNLEFNGGNLNLLFGQRRNLVNLRYWKMLLQIARFNRETIEELENPVHGNLSLIDYVKARNYGEDFLKWYLSPMAAAVWSSPPERVEKFPARTLMRFWHNHGFLGLNTQHQWRTVSEGSKCYVHKLTESFESCILRNKMVTTIQNLSQGVRIFQNDGSSQDFDRVIIATHADQALQILADPTLLEKTLLSLFRYQANKVLLHTDAQFMPKTQRCWAAWNYRIDSTSQYKNHYSTHYWMNRLQGVSEIEQYFVSINPPISPNPASIKRHLNYEHPIFDLAAISGQDRLEELHLAGKETRRYFCGAWQRYGFHEDGLWSAFRLCEHLIGGDPWP